MESKSHLMESLGSIKYRMISHVNKEILTSSFPICIPFASFLCLIALAKISSTTLNKSGENEHSFLAPET
jgi:hypothetical protein